MKKQTLTISYALLGLMLSVSHATDIYVAQRGSDGNRGTSDQPLSSLAAAQKLARKAAGREAVTVHVADGIYYLPEALIFTPEDSGMENKPVVYKAVNEGGRC